MDLRLSNHARERMEEQRIDRAAVERVVSAADVVTVGETAVEYDGADVGGRPIRVVVARDSQPPLVITAYIRRERLR